MKKLSIIVGFLALLLLAKPVSAQTIDGTINPGEWDSYYLGTYNGNFDVDVYGYADSTNLYAAYKADYTDPDWATSCTLNINGNFYFKTPSSASWPDQGYTLLEMTYPRVQQTDGFDWSDLGTLATNGVIAGYTDMYSASTADCANGTAGVYMAEFKIPLSLLTYAGDDGQIGLTGQYWGYDFAPYLYVTLPPERSAEITAPTPGSTVAGNVNFTAYLTDDDPDPIQWAVRQGTCDAVASANVFGNVSGVSDVATIDTSDLSNQTFSFTGDMSAMTPGEYCFIYNPVEDGGEANIRLTSEFNLKDTIAPLVTIESPNESDGVSGTVEIYGTVVEDYLLSHYNISVYPGGADFNDFSQRIAQSTVYRDDGFNNELIFSWDSTTVLDGEYLIRLAARDAAGNRSYAGDPYLGGDDSQHVIRVTVNNVPDLIGPPVDKNECKKDGWKDFNNPTFKNQGDCVSYVVSNDHAGKRE